MEARINQQRSALARREHVFDMHNVNQIMGGPSATSHGLRQLASKSERDDASR